MDSLTAVIAIIPPSIIFFIFSAILFIKWMRKSNRQTLYFAIAFLFMGLCFGMWVIRTLLYPLSVDLSDIDIFIRFGYVFGIAGTSFIGLAAIEMVKPALVIKTRNMVFFFVPAIFLAILMTFIAEPMPAMIAGEVDFVWSADVSFILSLVGLFYFIFPNYLFIWWLMENKDHRLYSKIMLMEIGLFVFCTGIIIEGSKVGMESFGILVRWITALGGGVMAYAYIKR